MNIWFFASIFYSTTYQQGLDYIMYKILIHFEIPLGKSGRIRCSPVGFSCSPWSKFGILGLTLNQLSLAQLGACHINKFLLPSSYFCPVQLGSSLILSPGRIAPSSDERTPDDAKLG